LERAARRTALGKQATSATAGGLVFTSGAQDNALHVFDAGSGEEIWKFDLPASAQATSMTYSIDGKQYLVIAAGGYGPTRRSCSCFCITEVRFGFESSGSFMSPRARCTTTSAADHSRIGSPSSN
jgi:hypothetical protein